MASKQQKPKPALGYVLLQSKLTLKPSTKIKTAIGSNGNALCAVAKLRRG